MSSEKDIRWQLEVHVIGAHVCLTSFEKGRKGRFSSVWVTWLPVELPHVAICGVLYGKEFRVRLPLWRDDVEK